MAQKTKTTGCAWCGREVEISDKGLLRPHRTPGNTHCVGGGQSAESSQALRQAAARHREESGR